MDATTSSEGVGEPDATKAMLKTYLDSLRSSVVWKLEGLQEWQLRWPMTGTGSNLLGIVKHLAAMEYGYLGTVFDRPGEDLPWIGLDAEPDADMWATLDETSDGVLALYRRAVAHADATVSASDLTSPGRVPWWPQPEVTLQRVLVHLAVETARHAGHLDIIREQLDGRIGLREANTNLPFADADTWADHVDVLRDVAIAAQWPGATKGEYAFPGPLRDRLLAAILDGTKTSTSSLLAGWQVDGDRLPRVGEREVLISSAGLPVGITETTGVRVVPLGEVDLGHALDEGEGFRDVAEWRAGHERFWASDEVRAELDDPHLTIDDATPVVLQRIRLLERL